MRKRKQGRKLSRKTGQRFALMKTLLVSLIAHKRIETTLAKAKSLRPFAEKMLSCAKEAVLDETKKVAKIRQMKKALPQASIEKLFLIAQENKERVGGFTRIVKLAPRISDASAVAFIEWVNKPVIVQEKVEKKAKSEKKVIAPTQEEKKEEISQLKA